MCHHTLAHSRCSVQNSKVASKIQPPAQHTCFSLRADGTFDYERCHTISRLYSTAKARSLGNVIKIPNQLILS